MYKTTRASDTYASARLASESVGADGGLVVPDVLPVLTKNELVALAQKNFSNCVAETLNRFYGTHFTGWDIEFRVGRHPIRLVNFGSRVAIAECWRNPEWKFSRFVRSVNDLIHPDSQPQFWDEIAIRISVLAAVLLKMEGDTEVDIAVPTGSFSAPLSALYAKQMGFPVGKIICCSNENSSVWELLYQGQLRTDGIAKRTLTTDGDCWIPQGLEQFIFQCCGQEEVWKYLFCCRQGAVYTPSENGYRQMRSDIAVTVASDDRILQTISGFWSAYSYLLSPDSALAYSGVQDYRVNEKGNRKCLILAEQSPECDLKTVSKALGVSVREVQSFLASH